MKILQIIQKPQRRGAEIFACQLALEFVKKNLQTDVVYLFSKANSDLTYDLNFIPLDANPARRFWDFKAYLRLHRIISQGKYDVVQANAADTLKYAVMSKLLFGWKARLIFRNASLMGRLIHSAIQRKYNQWLLSRCDLIISVSENCRQDLIQFYSQAKEVSVTVPSGTYLFEDVETKIHVDPEQRPVFINVGSFVWEKNHEFVLKIFQRYIERYTTGSLWLVGDGRLLEPIREKVKQMELDKRVVFWGSRRDVISFLKSADVMIMPSVVEGMPGVILEALACELPVVASNAGGIPEVVQDNVSGFCLSELREENYVKCMNDLTTDSSLRRRFTKAGKQAIRDTFNMTSIAEQFFKHYSTVINKVNSRQ